MANITGTLASATIVQTALDLVFTVRPLLRNITLSFGDVNGNPVANYGQQVITRILSIPEVKDFNSTASEKGDTDVAVTLNRFKEVKYSFSAVEYSSTDRNLIREVAEPMAIALANSMVDAVAELWTVGNFPTRTGPDAVANGSTLTKTVQDFSYYADHLVDIRKTLQKSGVPEMGRFYVANSDVYASLLQDSNITSQLYNNSAGDVVKTGKLPTVFGFVLSEYPALPTTGNLVAVAGTKDSTVLAARVPRDPRELIPNLNPGGHIGVITEPRTGLSVMVSEWIDMATLTVNTRLCWMYGVAVGNPNNLQLIVSA